MTKQCANAVVMVPPDDFGFNSQTARDNEFQHPAPVDLNVHATVMAEFNRAVDALTQHGIQVVLLNKNPQLPPLPDAVFPNNWFCTNTQGVITVFPMRTPNRQTEVRPEELRECLREQGFIVNIVRHFPHAPGQALEGTGAMIFDHMNRLIYAARSERCDGLLVQQFSHQNHDQAILFETCSSQGRPFYHTNVMLSVGEDVAVVCSEAIVESDRARVMAQLRAHQRCVIEITFAQAESAFCANLLQLKNQCDERCIVLSQTAFNAFTSAQRDTLAQHGKLIPIDVKAIEYMGGGSARCMLAEIFLPRA